MQNRISFIVVSLVLLFAAFASSAEAGRRGKAVQRDRPVPQESGHFGRCFGRKVAATKDYASCLWAAEFNAMTRCEESRLDRCNQKLVRNFQSAERSNDCVATGNDSVIQTHVQENMQPNFATKWERLSRVGRKCLKRKLRADRRLRKCRMTFSIKSSDEDVRIHHEARCNRKFARKWIRSELRFGDECIDLLGTAEPHRQNVVEFVDGSFCILNGQEKSCTDPTTTGPSTTSSTLPTSTSTTTTTIL